MALFPFNPFDNLEENNMSSMRTVSTSDTDQLHALAKQLARSKRVAFVVGAGISTAADIPDFRSASTGLFASLKERNPELKIASGKDLFHTNLFQREDTTRAFYMMCAELKRLADVAGPTETHKLMGELEEAGKLFRVYTQNIDALEAKAGLSYGLGEWKESVRTASSTTTVLGASNSPSKVKKGKGKAKMQQVPQSYVQVDRKQAKSTDFNRVSSAISANLVDGAEDREEPVASTSKLPELEELFNEIPEEPQFSEEPQSSQASTAIVPESPDQMQSIDKSMSISSIIEEGSTQEIPETQEMDMSRRSNWPQTELDQPLEPLLVDVDVTDQHMDPPTAITSGSQAEDIMPSCSQTLPLPSQPKATAIKRSLTVPKVIPLHGTLDEMHCPKCNHVEPLSRWIHVLESGHSIHCPQCLALNASRNALGERSRGVGVMKVSVVLYGEEHKQANRVGEITEKDLLKAARPDFLVVAGTTLKIPGVKKLVREMSRLIKQLNEYEEEIKDEQGNGTGVWNKKKDENTPRVLFVNMDPPAPEKTWNDVFDVHVQGDVQTFASIVRQELAVLATKKLSLPSASQGEPLANLSTFSRQPTIGNYFNAQKVTVGSLKLGKKGKTGAASVTGVAKGNVTLSGFKQKKKLQKKGKKASPSPAASLPAAPVVPKPPKEKKRPGWTGYALAPLKEVISTKADYWVEKLPEGSKRQRKAAPIPPAPARALSHSAIRPKKGKGRAKAASPNTASTAHETIRPTSQPIQSTPSRCQTPDNATASAAKSSMELSTLLSQQLGTAFSPARKPAFSLPSNASTPPSLASDVDTVSDAEDVASVKEATIPMDVIISSSQETQVVSDSISPEVCKGFFGPESSLDSFTKSSTAVISDSQPSLQESQSAIYSPMLSQEAPASLPRKSTVSYREEMTETESEDADATDDDYEMRNPASAKRARMEMSPPDKTQVANKKQRVPKGRKSTSTRKKSKKTVAIA